MIKTTTFLTLSELIVFKISPDSVGCKNIESKMRLLRNRLNEMAEVELGLSLTIFEAMVLK